MRARHILIEIRGGCFQNAVRVPKGYRIEPIDWDNLLGDGADTAAEWDRLSPQARAFVRRMYHADYRRIVRAVRDSSRK